MNTRQLQYIVTVAEEKSISAAAERLMISQPSLSQFISKLENELGVILFERTLPIKLTYEGEMYLKTAKKIMAEEAELLERYADIRGGMSGTLKIGAGYLNSTCVLPEITKAFLDIHPNVHIEVYEDTEPNLKIQADGGDLDLVMATSNFDSARYEKQLIYEEDYLFAVPKIFSLQGDKQPKDELPTLQLMSLENIPIVRLQKKTYLRDLIDSVFEMNHITSRSSVECTTAISAYNMAKNGVGATIISYTMYKNHYSTSLDYFQVHEFSKKRQISLYYNKSKYLTNAAKEFIRVACGFHGQNLYDDCK